MGIFRNVLIIMFVLTGLAESYGGQLFILRKRGTSTNSSPPSQSRRTTSPKAGSIHGPADRDPTRISRSASRSASDRSTKPPVNPLSSKPSKRGKSQRRPTTSQRQQNIDAGLTPTGRKRKGPTREEYNAARREKYKANKEAGISPSLDQRKARASYQKKYRARMKQENPAWPVRSPEQIEQRRLYWRQRWDNRADKKLKTWGARQARSDLPVRKPRKNVQPIAMSNMMERQSSLGQQSMARQQSSGEPMDMGWPPSPTRQLSPSLSAALDWDNLSTAGLFDLSGNWQSDGSSL